MNCPHIAAAAREYNECALGLFGGRPSHGTCRYCIERGQNNAAHAASVKSAPPFLTQAATLMPALGRFAASGFAFTHPDILAEREATCRACPEWDAAALNCTGRCRKCGCSTWAKLRLATERCPLGKWEAVTPSAPLPETLGEPSRI